MAAKEHAFSSLGKAIVLVVVGQGEEEKVSALHESLLCKRSAFFRKCLREEWKEGQDRIVEFREDDPIIFDLWVASLYAGTIPDIKTDEDSPSAHWVTLGKVFAFAQMIQDTCGKNIVVEEIFKRGGSRNIDMVVDPTSRLPHEDFTTMVKTIYESTIQQSPIRKLLVEMFAMHKGTIGYELRSGSEEHRAEFNRVLGMFPTAYSHDLVQQLFIDRGYHEFLSSVENYLEVSQKDD